MKSVTELRKYQYDYHTKLYPYLNDWKRNPYTWLKARFYMETSAILVYFLLKTKIKPNTVTIVYGLLGIIGGILLGISKNPTVIIAIAIFFLKGILDWSDGHLARVTGQTSITGYVLDVYGALLNDLGFQIGLGFYVAFKTGNPIFYYMIFLIPFFYAVNLKSFSQAVLFEKILKRSFINNEIKGVSNVAISNKEDKDVKLGISGRCEKCFKYFSSFLDARARSVDFICLLILVEMFVGISITWIIFVAFIIKGFLKFIGGYYITIKKGWIENLSRIIYD